MMRRTELRTVEFRGDAALVYTGLYGERAFDAVKDVLTYFKDVSGFGPDQEFAVRREPYGEVSVALGEPLCGEIKIFLGYGDHFYGAVKESYREWLARVIRYVVNSGGKSYEKSEFKDVETAKCMYDIIKGENEERLESKYGRETVESLAGTEKNPILAEASERLLKEIESLKKELETKNRAAFAELEEKRQRLSVEYAALTSSIKKEFIGKQNGLEAELESACEANSAECFEKIGKLEAEFSFMEL